MVVVGCTICLSWRVYKVVKMLSIDLSDVILVGVVFTESTFVLEGLGN